MLCNLTDGDYNPTNILVSIDPGTLTAQFTINITNDAIIECYELFNLSIAINEAWCGLTSTNNAAQVTIVDDDGQWEILTLCMIMHLLM